MGNPPYITLKKDIDFDPTDPAFKDLISGQINAATLMIGKGLNILKKTEY
ncbi:hypothetical protein KHA80_08060 [Anaerobacillus sp. HL2]|nr:hypothetical protein KHA80_08060 [Anaerobacillus sp. HL2]